MACRVSTIYFSPRTVTLPRCKVTDWSLAAGPDVGAPAACPAGSHSALITNPQTINCLYRFMAVYMDASRLPRTFLVCWDR